MAEGEQPRDGQARDGQPRDGVEVLPAPTGARRVLCRLPRIAEYALPLMASLFVLISLVPPGSYPVGWDVWWNLHVARGFAETGFPDALPAAGFTQLARDYADRQILFHGILSVFGGRELGPEHVPYLLYGFAAALLAALVFAARLLAARPFVFASVLLYGLSSTALFRACALRDMLLALPILVLFVARLARCGEAVERRDQLWIAACGFAYTLSHGAPVLLPALVAIVAIGRRFDGGPFRFFATLWPAVVGIAFALLARPNPVGAFELLWTLNVEMPIAAVTGALPIHPAEFSAVPPLSWLRANWPLACGAIGIAALAARGRASWSLALPGLVLTVGSLFGVRLLELAVPMLVLAMLVAWPVRLRHPLLILALGTITLVHAHWRAGPSVEANRFVAARDVAQALVDRADPGDVVFVTDWGLSSPLAFWTREKRLVFTGVTDPVLMLHEDPELFAAWWRIKAAQDPRAAATARARFGARFVAVSFSDAAPGRPAGECSVAIWRSMAALEADGQRIESSDHASPPAHRAIEKGFRLYDMAPGVQKRGR